MQVIVKEIEYVRPDIFYLYPFSDVHLGAPECAEKALKAKVGECVERGRNAIAVGVGDWCDSITHKDKRFDMNGLAGWVSRSNIVESQRRRAREIFSPLAEGGQLLGIGTGNHEEMIHIVQDNDVIRNLCNDMGVPYAGYQCFYVLKFKRAGRFTHTVKVHVWHGSGAAQTEGARMSRLLRLVNDFEADIYLLGHLHTIMAHTPDRLVERNGKVRSVRLAAAICGSWLKTYNQPGESEELDPSYGEQKGYKPSRIGMPVIKIYPDAYNDPYRDQFEVIC